MTAAASSIKVTREPTGILVSVRGELDLASSIRLGAVLGDLIDGQGNLAIDIDLRQVTTVDPAALGVIEVANGLVGRRGGKVAVKGLRGRVALDRTATAPGQSGSHLVEFYENERSLTRSVREYLEPALQGDETAVIVATREHRGLFEAALIEAGIDLDGARQTGRYVGVDAEALLSRFIVDGTPNAARFHSSVGHLIADAAQTGRSVRVYGEMVAVLWVEGNVAAALALEELWNELAASRSFSLLCAYPTTAFAPTETNGLFRAICEQHTSA